MVWQAWSTALTKPMKQNCGSLSNTRLFYHTTHAEKAVSLCLSEQIITLNFENRILAIHIKRRTCDNERRHDTWPH